MTVTAQERVRQIADWLGIFMVPGQVVELVGLQVAGRKAVNRFFRGEEREEMARQALRWEAEGAGSVRFTLNPLRPDCADSRRFVKDDDVIARRWLMVDTEAVEHATGESATEEERAAAWAVLDRCRGVLDGAGLTGAVVCDSGNGWHLFYPVDLANDEVAKEQIKRLLKGLRERCSDERAHVDAATYQAVQLGKVYGTATRKGVATPERPHRYTRVVEGSAPTAEMAAANTARLTRLLGLWQQQEDLRKGPRRAPLDAGQRDAARTDLYARTALERERAAVAGAQPGTRANQAFRSAAAIGQLVGAGMLGQAIGEQTLIEAAVAAGLPADEAASHVRRGIAEGRTTPRQLPETNGHHPAMSATQTASAGAASVTEEDRQVASLFGTDAEKEEPRQITFESVANIDDLIKAGSEVTWFWEGWIQTGVLTAVAAEAGTGKTRFCTDLLRRIRHGLPWPDGQPMHLPCDSRSLWVAADNHHDELVTLAQSFGVVDAMWLNAPKKNPYGGVTLETIDDLLNLDARIRAVKPAVVIIDTVGNSTDKNLCRQEDAKAYYFPLQVIARRHRIAMLCLTHLNTGGKFLGKRVLEKVRVAIQLEHPNPADDRRALRLHKSNSKKPAPLGVTMGDRGNEYDSDPPKGMEGTEPGQQTAGSPRLQECVEWLRQTLSGGPMKVHSLRTEAETAGYSTKTLYKARESLSVIETVTENKKWWGLAPIEEEIE